MLTAYIRRNVPSIVLVVLGLIVIVCSLERSDTFQICIDSDTYSQKDRGGEDPNKTKNIPNYFDCAVYTFEANDDLVVALATIFIAGFTGVLWLDAGQGRDHFRAAERAYITASHKKALIIDEYKGSICVPIEIKNNGQTPARVSDVFITFAIENKPTALPCPPPDHAAVSHFLVRNATFITNPRLSEFSCFDCLAIRDGRKAFWLYGYVDYMDRFKGRHRAGYLRRYEPNLDGTSNNLVFENVPALNDDRPRKPGEGNDWDND